MNKVEFMVQLERLLQGIPQQEKVEAIQYYNDYFEDAGEENEQEVIEALGTPEKVAENIKRDLYQNRYSDMTEPQHVASGREVVKYQPQTERTEQTRSEAKKSGLSTGIIVLIVVLCLLASPVLLGVLTGLAGVFVAVAAVWFALVASCGIIAFVMLVVGAILAVVGIMGIFASPLAGVGIFGSSLVVMAIGLLALMLVVLLVGKITPAVFKGIAWIFRKLFGKNKAV